MLPKQVQMHLDGTVTVSGKCIITGKQYTTAHFPISEFEAWQAGDKHIQYACPSLGADDREFLITSTSPEGWNKIFPPEPEMRIVQFFDPHPGLLGCPEPLPEAVKAMADEIANEEGPCGVGRGAIELALKALEMTYPDGEWKVFEPNRPDLFGDILPDGMICLVVDVNGGYTKGGTTNSWRVLCFKDIDNVS